MTEITFLAPDTDAFVDSVQRHIGEYESASGDTVHLEIIASDRYFSNDIGEYLSKPIDVFMSGPVLLWEHVGTGHVEPLDRFFEADDEEYDSADFVPNLIAANRWAGTIGSPIGTGPLLEIPVNCESYNLAYIPETLARFGLEVPHTWDEYFEVARAVATGSGGAVRGFAQRGLDIWHTIYTGFATQFWSSGARDFDDDGRTAIASPEAIAVTEQFITALRESGPSDWLNQRWYELAMDFAKGDYGLIVDSDHYVAFFEDSATSAMAGKVGYALPPAGSDGSIRPNLWTWSMVMNSRSEKKDAAWAFMRWATGREFLLRSAFEGNMNPTRTSIWDDASFQDHVRPWPGFLEVSRDLIENRGRVLVTPAANYIEIGNRWTAALRAAYAGEDVATALAAAAVDIDALVDAQRRREQA